MTSLEIDEYFTRTTVVDNTTTSLLTAAFGSAVGLSNDSGTVVSEYTYEPFGESTMTGSFNSNPFQFTSRENDSTGLYYYRARYYHPNLQRFVSEDPIELRGGNANFYGYVNNNPLNFFDPTGLFTCKGTWQVVASSARALWTCWCYWGCFGCEGSTPLYENPYSLPRTPGVYIATNAIEGGAGTRCGSCAKPDQEEGCPCKRTR